MTARNKVLRNRAARKQRSCCYYCGYPVWTNDVDAFAQRFSITKRAALRFQCTAEHVHALGDGGKNSAENVVAACLFCNRMRHQRSKRVSAEAYLALVQRRLAKHRWHPDYFQRLIRSVSPATPPP